MEQSLCDRLLGVVKAYEKEKKERTGTLDLGNCGLTELPEELFELTWLERNGFVPIRSVGFGDFVVPNDRIQVRVGKLGFYFALDQADLALTAHPLRLVGTFL